MRLSALAMLVIVLGQAPARVPDAAAIDAVKQAPAHDLDPALPGVTFEAWLRSLVGPQSPIKWGVNDCGEQTGNPAQDKDRDFPMCVEAVVSLAGDRALVVSLVVGTLRAGMGAHPPKFWSAAILKTGTDPKFVSSLAQVAGAIQAGRGLSGAGGLVFHVAAKLSR